MLKDYLYNCPTQAGRRFAQLGGYVLYGLGDVAKVERVDLVKYANTTVWIQWSLQGFGYVRLWYQNNKISPTRKGGVAT